MNEHEHEHEQGRAGRAAELERAAGALVVGGFDGLELPSRFRAALAAGTRGGLIVFRRNIASCEQAAALCASAHAARPGGAPPVFACVDQEGGRVSRLPAPFPRLAPMRALGRRSTEALEAAGRAVGELLAALGFTVNFAPVLDVDSNPNNPVIGDRAFASEPAGVARAALAFGRGLEAAGLLACGKHFPGHGDTDVDSHVDLPIVRHARARLDAVELAPFRAASPLGLGSLMTAHVVCEALDPGVPATLSRAVCTDLLRGELGYEGLLVSDDLEMSAIAARFAVEHAAVESVRAGCDVVLVCKHEDLQDRAVEALAREASRDPVFARRVAEAGRRAAAARARFATAPVTAPTIARFTELLARPEIARALAAVEPNAPDASPAHDPTERA